MCEEGGQGASAEGRVATEEDKDEGGRGEGVVEGGGIGR